MLGDLFYRLGAAMGALDNQLRGMGAGGFAPGRRQVAIYDPEDGDVHELDDDDTADTAEHAVLTAAAAWFLTRLLRPKPVNWPRLILAGAAATALADLVGRTAEEEGAAGREPYATGSEELMARFGAGMAVAAGYAALVYPRIPGPPLLRGLIFGGLEVLAAPRGGLIRIAAEVPGVKFPLQALALPVDEDAGPMSHMAYGLGLGLLYRYE